jgi:DUF1365 family protein
MTIAASALFEGWVMHRRLAPRRHRFRYRVFNFLIDLDELPTLDDRLRFFGWNRRALFEFRDSDHGDGSDLRGWVASKLAEAKISADGAIRVLCYPRMLGYVFNPISVWFCHRRDGTLAATIYEVHNTYGERHSYVLPVQDTNAGVRQTADKTFYVSPFLSQDCVYRFRTIPPGERVDIGIQETEGGVPILTACFSGQRRALNDLGLLSALLRYPLMTLKVTVAIHYEAVRLMWKGVRRHPWAPAAQPR